MKGFYNRIRSVLTLGIAIIFLLNLFIKSNLINDCNLILMLIVVGLSFIVVSSTTLIIGGMLFGLSIILFLFYHAPLSVWQQALQENIYLVVMFTLVPLLGIPIRHGGYFEALQGLFRRYVYSSSRFYLLVSFVSAFVGVLVNLAVVPLVLQISEASSISSNKKLLSSAILRGFATCTIWAPTTAAIALIVQLSGASWILFFPYAILFGVMSGLVGYFMTMYEEKRADKPLASVVEEPDLEFDVGKIVELSIFSIILISAIAVVSLLTGMHTVIVVSLAALIYPVIWLGIIGRLRILMRDFKCYFNESLPKLQNEIILFVGAGLFATSINYSHLGNYVSVILSKSVGQNALLLAIVIIIAILMLSALGIHPIIPVTIIGGTVKAAAYGVTPTYLALILAISWAMGISISPSSATVIALSGMTGQSPIYVGPRWNGLYVLIASGVMLTTLTIIRLIGWV
ncbi:C4-dicarboxylate ABC transporter [Desulfosporosinus sp.]|uniref:C4-dicarboxylate ABC transporter n=1 Tax=Desulfosporosinus sp. TaxID=157907 RepID=UPI002326159A|nr:C4-dicarboxylate ABC transporter [Desulfosporosinus sp.]MCO5386354.1 C4-dicarboxylate ABC transporter [Desulfosporosinus sp.]MDA8223974.1 C4-dicarboxylate ABC transporter [Desulfitobacterium hafniense]